MSAADLNVGAGRLARSCGAGASRGSRAGRARSSGSVSPRVWDRYKRYILGALVLAVGPDGAHRRLARSAGAGGGRPRRRCARSQAALRTRATERIRDLGGRLLTAQETERSRIARELHDDISQQVALLSIDLELLNDSRRRRSRCTLAGEALEPHAGASPEACTTCRTACIRPSSRLIGLVAALAGLQHELSQPASPITFTHDRRARRPCRRASRLCLFRVVQEALQNALKHSARARIFRPPGTGRRSGIGPHRRPMMASDSTSTRRGAEGSA